MEKNYFICSILFLITFSIPRGLAELMTAYWEIGKKNPESTSLM
jgi:hypothetical protein